MTPVNVIEPSTLWSGLSLQEKDILMAAEESPIKIGTIFNVMPGTKECIKEKKDCECKCCTVLMFYF